MTYFKKSSIDSFVAAVANVPLAPITNSYQEALERAAQKGLVVRHPKENELFLDIDTPEQMEVFSRTLEVLKRFVAVKAVVDDPSSSGRLYRRHITVVLEKPVTKIERIAFQAALGSDPMREMLSLARIADNDSHPTLFFEKPA